jgi:hypothetical protein
MSNIIKLKETSFDDITLVKRSLMNLRKCYPQFSEWYDSKILPNLNNDTRRIFLATNNGEFSGALILKRTDEEKKVTECNHLFDSLIYEESMKDMTINLLFRCRNCKHIVSVRTTRDFIYSMRWN